MFAYSYRYTRASGASESGVHRAGTEWAAVWWEINGGKVPDESKNIVKFEGFVYEINEDLTLSLHNHFSYEAPPVKPRTVINKK